ncbi:MAG: GMC oxidoreductase, partial [Anaerolineae bacterium]
RGQDDDADFLRGYGFQVIPIRPDWQMTYNQRGFGAQYKEKLRKPAPYWIWGLAGFLECLPRSDNRVYLHPTRRDRFGIPLVTAEFSWSDNERKLARDTGVQAEKIFRAAGAMFSSITAPEQLSEGGAAIHEMGTARMGDDPAQSVLNKYNQDVHDLIMDTA